MPSDDLLRIIPRGIPEPVEYRTPDGRTLVIPAGEPTFAGSPIPWLLDFEALHGIRLRDGRNPLWLMRVHENDFEGKAPPDLTFAEFVRRRHPDKIEVVGGSTSGAGVAGAAAPPPEPLTQAERDVLVAMLELDDGQGDLHSIDAIRNRAGFGKSYTSTKLRKLASTEVGYVCRRDGAAGWALTPTGRDRAKAILRSRPDTERTSTGH